MKSSIMKIPPVATALVVALTLIIVINTVLDVLGFQGVIA